ncbi:MAG: hypothetical protein PHI73_04860 [Patescibacteria group bacterium]|nr:hypothetical protein [Patescibacteria group bacterium]
MRNNQAGVTLVLSLLVLTVVTAVATALSILIINEVLNTRGITSSVKSFYGAEVGIEQGLWLVQKARRDGTSIEDAANLLAGGQQLSDPRVQWTRLAEVKSESITINLRKDESAFFELYTPDDQIGMGVGPPSELSITFEECAAGPTKVEATWTGWKAGVGFFEPSYKSYPIPCNGTSISLEDPINDPERFRLQLRAFDGAATKLTFVVKDEAHTIINLSSQIKITVTGEYPSGSLTSSSQAIEAKVPWLIPISGIFSYAVFSEEDIIKN